MVVVFLMPWSLVSAVPSLIASRDCDSEFCLPSVPQVIDGVGELWKTELDLGRAAGVAAGGLIGGALDQATGLSKPPATEPATPETRIFSGATIDPATGLSKPPATGPATPETRIFSGGTIDPATGLLKPPATGPATPETPSFGEGTIDQATGLLNPPAKGPATPETPILGGTPNVNIDSTPDTKPDIEIDVIQPPWSTTDCDTAPAAPPLLDPHSNLVSHSFFV